MTAGAAAAAPSAYASKCVRKIDYRRPSFPEHQWTRYTPCPPTTARIPQFTPCATEAVRRAMHPATTHRRIVRYRPGGLNPTERNVRLGATENLDTWEA